MFILKLSRVPDNFVSCWVQCYNSDFYKNMKPDKQNIIWIKDKRLANEIRNDYDVYKSSKLSLDQYFQRTILYGSYTREKEKIFIRKPDDEVTSVPIFLINNRNNRQVTGWTIKDLNSRQAIKMKTEHICKLHNCSYISVDLDNPPDNIEIYQINEGKGIYFMLKILTKNRGTTHGTSSNPSIIL